MNALPVTDTARAGQVPPPALPAGASAALGNTRVQQLLRRHPPGQSPHPLAAVLAAYHQGRAAAASPEPPRQEPAP